MAQTRAALIANHARNFRSWARTAERWAKLLGGQGRTLSASSSWRMAEARARHHEQLIANELEEIFLATKPTFPYGPEGPVRKR